MLSETDERKLSLRVEKLLREMFEGHEEVLGVTLLEADVLQGPGSTDYKETFMNRAGTFTFHPTGTLSRVFNISFGGAIFPVSEPALPRWIPMTGNFAATLPYAGETWNLIPVQEGQQIDFFVNPSPRIGAGAMSRQ